MINVMWFASIVLCLAGSIFATLIQQSARQYQALIKGCPILGIGADDALAVGDGANDLAMIQRAGLGVAYYAKPLVAVAAGASIQHGDLSGLLYLQGYSDSEIVRLD